jgi:shikimate dehydrogenase
MNLTRVLQPYVCCLGNPVAGNPTQFVMYRAARATGVDWRFFTSQVEIGQFEVAFRGVQALGLSGMALFDPFQTASLSLLDSVTESAMCLGKANVARLDGNSWLGDNTLGSAIMNCVRPLLTSPVPPESEDSVGKPAIDRTCILVVGARNIAKAMRLANAELASRIVVVDEGLEADGIENVNGMWELTSFDAFAQLEIKIDCLVLDSLPNAAIARHLSSLGWSNRASCMMVGSVSEKQLRLWQDSLKVTGLTRIEPVELMTHQAAADFFFWTGAEPSIDMIRDSLEEYMQW